MSGVDDRIVSMKFDNASFEQKLSATIASLDKLTKTIENAGKTHGLQELGTQANNVDMSKLSSAVEGISGKFTALGTIAIGALLSIGAKAFSTGAQILKSLTLDPIMDGYREFETNMNSIQTILANTDSKGTTLTQVNAALDQLNQYSDKTIYNFAQMARNIGTFTAAGIDLDTSVQSIKGIANLAAVSGSNAEQASTAMYQLSQALATGTVKLMDWNSVVNAGMGGEVFQKALFETGKKMKTISGVPMSMTFDQWKDAGNSFRLSLEQGWLTADVLTETLQGFTGDLTEAQLLSMGYTKEQAAEIFRMGQVAQKAATEVKTLTQLVGTVKEAVGSGWSATFRTVIGDFEESKTLFTNINNAIGGFVSRSADARNAMLQGWKDMGGRTALIEGFKNIFSAIGDVIRRVSLAFREIFPKTTTADLLHMTASFVNFTEKLKMGGDTIANLFSTFRGFFALLSIGWEIVKGIAGLFVDLFRAIAPAGGSILGFTGNLGDMLTQIQASLVEGGKIRDFFDKLGEIIKKPIDALKSFKEIIVGIFAGFSGSEEVEAAVDRIGGRFEHLRGIAERLGDIWNGLSDRLSGVINVLNSIWDFIKNWFKELGNKIADEMSPADFDAAVDIVNVGLLGGIAILLKKFLSGGLKLDFGGGLIDKIKDSFDGLTGTLKAMQADLKAKALLKIAAAVGILTLSMVALSLIDSKALAKALVAITVGFGQLVGVMMLIDKFGGTAIKTNAIAASMILMATAIGVLSIAVKNMADLSWSELAKGLTGVAVGMGILVAATKLLTADKAGMISAGIAMTAMAVAMRILALAVAAFAEMSWGELAKGLTGVAVGLGVVALAANAMPSNMALTGPGLIAVAVGLRILAEAVEAFAEMGWAEMGKGLLGIAGGLVVIAGAMSLMPVNIPITAAGVLILSAALLVMAEAVEKMGKIKFGEMAKGIGAFAAMLVILAVAMNAMTGTLTGAASLLVVSGALLVLTHVLKELSKLSIAELATAIGALAAVFLVLGGAALLLEPIVPALLGISVALGLIGASFALFGVGVMLVAKSFEVLAKSGAAGAKAVVEIIKVFVTAKYEIIKAFAETVIGLVQELLDAAPTLVKAAKVLLLQILDTIIDLAPKMAETLGVVLSKGLALIRAKFPEVMQTGMLILLTFLRGIRDNIGEIVSVVAEIITGFLDALALKVPEIIDSVYNLIIAVIKGVLEKLGDITGHLLPKGVELISGLLSGINKKATELSSWFTKLPGKILGWIGDITKLLWNKGIDFLSGLLGGLGAKIVDITNWFTGLPGKIVGWVGDVTRTLLAKGVDFIAGLLSGIVNKAKEVTSWLTDLPKKIFGWIGNVLGTLKSKGLDLLQGLWDGLKEKLNEVGTWLLTLPSKLLDFVKNLGRSLYNVGRDVMNGLWDGLKDVWDGVTKWLQKLNPARFFNDINPYKGHAIKNLVSTGAAVMQGLHNGMKHQWNKVADWLSSIDPSSIVNDKKIESTLNDTFNSIVSQLKDLEDLSLTITPVLDLSNVQDASKNIDRLMRVSPIVPEISTSQARVLSAMAFDKASSPEVSESAVPTEIKFEQHNYSPEPLSTNDIYRNTKSQLALAKEELNIG